MDLDLWSCPLPPLTKSAPEAAIWPGGDQGNGRTLPGTPSPLDIRNKSDSCCCHQLTPTWKREFLPKHFKTLQNSHFYKRLTLFFFTYDWSWNGLFGLWGLRMLLGPFSHHTGENFQFANRHDFYLCLTCRVVSNSFDFLFSFSF